MMPDLSEPVRDALIAAAAITSELPVYQGSYPIFTRVPVPDDAEYPLIVVGAQVQAGSEDGVSDERPVVVRDITVYGENTTAAKYRAVERAAHAIHAIFHRRRGSIIVPDWAVMNVTAVGPAPAPVDNEQTVGRRVSVTFRLARQY